MTGHHAHQRSLHARNIPPASDHRLDQFAAAVSEARDTNPTLAALATMEDQFLDTAMDIGSHLDRQTVGASWLIAGQLLTTHVQSVPPEQQAATLGALLNVLKLAGQRLYTGDRLPVEMPCPFPYMTGAPCKTVIKAPSQERADLMMGAHVWQQHPGETWPPKPEAHEAEITVDGKELSRPVPVPEPWREVEPTEPQAGPQYEIENGEDPYPPSMLGEDPTYEQLRRFVNVRVLAMTSLAIDRQDGDPVTGRKGDLTPQAAWKQAEHDYEELALGGRIANCACGEPAVMLRAITNRPGGQPGDVQALCGNCADAEDRD